MWRREVGNEVLRLCRDKGWLLDVEFLAVAHRRGYRIAEVPVTWSEVPGSKVKLVRDSWGMFRGLWRIRRSLRHLNLTPQAGVDKVGVVCKN
jgi:dolichyl-phosphate beta-glucosyltransferase